MLEEAAPFDEDRDDDGPAVVPLFEYAQPPSPANRWIASADDVTASALMTEWQWALVTVAPLALLCAAAFAPVETGRALHVVLAATFLAAAAWRLWLVGAARLPPVAELLPDAQLPAYTVICPLFREAAMVGPLLQALEALDYPRDRLQVLIALERDDAETVAAVAAAGLPPWIRAVLTPPGTPQTKPRACNVALALATGELLVVYDAEDRPHPGQLREAAARFARNEDGLVCLQAPLRIMPRRSFFQRQFAMEYAAQFEVTLHAFARAGLPFPLGGTSNHFRTSALRSLGGWDPWNVTEDADLGFRIADRGWRTATLRLHTLETSPETRSVWLRQRTRWLKGYMQTLAVWTRRPPSVRSGLAMAATLGLSVGSALLHAWFALVMFVQVVWAVSTGRVADVVWLDLTVLLAGWWSAGLLIRRGAGRAGFQPDPADYAALFLYWPLLTWAAWRAVWQLLRDPFLWEKTPHFPPTEPPDWTEPTVAD